MTDTISTNALATTEPTLLDNIISAAQAMSALEVIAVICGLLYIVLVMRENIWCWAFALISTSIYIYLFWHVSLFMESALNVYYVIMAFVGWWQWKYGKAKLLEQTDQQLIIQKWPLQYHAIALAGIIILSYVSGYLLTENTQASYPFLDSFTSWAAVFATWLVARKVLSNWIYWIVIDILGTWLFWQKGLYLTSLLFGLYTILAIVGYTQWKALYDKSKIKT